jgi:hypothetical protein
VVQRAIKLDYGGMRDVHALTGISRSTIKKGMQEMGDRTRFRVSERRRRAGGNHKGLEVLDPALRRDLNRLMD